MGALHQITKALCVGDSLTEGLFRYWEMAPYTDTLAECLGPNWQVENAGVSGETTKEIRQRLLDHKILRPGTCDAVLILGGTNDLSELSGKQIADNLRSLHQLACEHNANCQVFMLSIPQMRVGSELFQEEKRMEINESLKQLCEESPNSHYIDWAQEIPNPPGSQNSDDPNGELWSDNIHLSRLGYQKMGTVIYDRIKDYLPTARKRTFFSFCPLL